MDTSIIEQCIKAIIGKIVKKLNSSLNLID